jgi:hypothetical protein
MAREAFMKALSRHVELVFNPRAEKHRYGKHKLQRNQ